MISERIKNITKQNRFTLQEVAEKIGMSPNGFHLAMKNNDFKSSTLIKIAELFKVPVSYFFEEGEGEGKGSATSIGTGNIAVSGGGKNFLHGPPAGYTVAKSEVSELKEKVQHLTELLAEKDKLIAEKERLIKMLLREEKLR